MILKNEVMVTLLKACPSFRPSWDASDDKELLYVIMGDLARHLLELYNNKLFSELTSIGVAIEELHTGGDRYVKELATIGILEGIQNVWANNGTDADKFKQFLLPESLKWWNSLNKFWNQEIPYVGHDIVSK